MGDRNGLDYDGEIIDSHAHIGAYHDKQYHCKELLEIMNESGINSALVSNLDGASGPQIEANAKTLDAARKNKGRLFGLAWANPKEGLEALRDVKACLEDAETFKGVKFHPTDNAYAFNDISVNPFLDLAARYDVPVVVHTADDEFSSPKQVYEMAKRHPKTNVVMYHTCIYDARNGGGKREAMRYSKELPNLYLETSWVDAPFIAEAVKVAGADKVIFGTDAPFEGKYHYPNYFRRLKEAGSTKTELRIVMYENSKKLFKI